MATMSSTLVLGLKDRVTRNARGISAALGAIQKNAAFGTRALGTVRNMAVLGAGYLGVKAGLDGVVGSAMKFESAMADLAKKSTLTSFQLQQMEKDVTKLSNSMPLAKTEIAGLIAQAAQFGIATEDLKRFALLGAKSAIAFDMVGTEASESLSKLKNAFGLDMAGLEGLADAINYTADSAGTSEGQLIDFLLRTAASAKQYGISGQQMAAFGATLNEIGIESSKAGTGINAMMAKLAGVTKNKKAVKALDALGGAGYSRRLQKKFFDTPVDAMKEFFNLVKKMPAESRAGLLIDFLGLEYQDDGAAIANNIEKITDRLNGLGDAGRYLGSVDRTFEIFANTTEQKLKVLSNNLQNIGQAFGAHLLPPIAEFSDKVVGALGSMDQRVSVIDRLSTSVNGFISGLGFDGKTLGGALNDGFDLLFGKLDGAQAAGETMGRLFADAKRWGENARSFADGVASIGKAVLDFTGLDSGQVGSLLGSLGGYGFKLMLASVGFSMAAGAIWNLGKALAFLTGMSTAWSILKGAAKFGGTLFGLGLGTKAIRTPPGGASPKGAPANPGAATGWRALFNAIGLGGLLGATTLGIQSLGDTPGATFKDQVDNQRKFREFLHRMFGIGKPKPAASNSTNENWLNNSGTGMGNTSGPLDILKPLENRLQKPGNDNGKPDEVSILGVPKVTLTNPIPAPQIHIAVTVHATTNANAQEIGNQVAAQIGREVSDKLAGLQADREWAVA